MHHVSKYCYVIGHTVQCGGTQNVCKSCGIYTRNSYIPLWGVVVLHIGVSLTPMCKTTPQGEI